MDVGKEAIGQSWAQTMGVPHRLKVLARRAGMNPIEVDRGGVHELTTAELRRYNLSDVRATAGLYSGQPMDCRAA